MNGVLAIAIAVAASGLATAALLLLSAVQGVTGPASLVLGLATVVTACALGSLAGVACGLLSCVGLGVFLLGRGHGFGVEGGVAAAGLIVLGGVTGRLTDALRRRRGELQRRYAEAVELVERLRQERGTPRRNTVSTAPVAPLVVGGSVRDLLVAVRQISGSLNEQRILEATLRAIHEVCAVPRVVLHLHDRRTDQILPGVAFPGEGGEIPAGPHEALMRLVVQSREVLLRARPGPGDEGPRIVLPLFDRTMLTGFVLVFGPLDDVDGTAERVAVVATACGLALSGARLSARVEQQLRLDPHTGLPGSEAIREVAQSHLARGPMAVVLIAADGLRQVNEQYGRKAGDRSLAGLARLVALEVAGDGTVGRYGGASLLVVLPGHRSASAAKLAERLRRRARATLAAGPDGLADPLTISVGVASAAIGPLEPLLQGAERALACAMDAGGDRVVTEDAGVGSHVQQ